VLQDKLVESLGSINRSRARDALRRRPALTMLSWLVATYRSRTTFRKLTASSTPPTRKGCRTPWLPDKPRWERYRTRWEGLLPANAREHDSPSIPCRPLTLSSSLLSNNFVAAKGLDRRDTAHRRQEIRKKRYQGRVLDMLFRRPPFGHKKADCVSALRALIAPNGVALRG
jgi:hypothetical protein